VQLKARLEGGKAWRQDLHPHAAGPVAEGAAPLELLFARQQLDSMSSHAWASSGDRDAQAARKVERLSVALGVPCGHTRLVLFPTTRQGLAQLRQVQREGKSHDVASYAAGGADCVRVVGAGWAASDATAAASTRSAAFVAGGVSSTGGGPRRAACACFA
jgi:hypothetical protein